MYRPASKRLFLSLIFFGALSGLLSAYLPLTEWTFLDVPPGPALYFAPVVAATALRWNVTVGKAAALLAFLGAVVGWWAGANTSLAMDRMLPSLALDDTTRLIRDASLGMAAGFVGGLITVFGVAVGSEGKERKEWLWPIAFATVAGALYALVPLLPEPHGLTPLFVVWQAGLVALIARALQEQF